MSNFYTVRKLLSVYDNDFILKTNVPWLNDPAYADFNANNVYLTRSGDKVVNPFVKELLNVHNLDERKKIWNNLSLPYANKWRRLWDNIENSTYDPIENFNGIEEITDTTTYGSKVTMNNTDTLKHDTTDTTTGNGTAEQFVNGWNVKEATPQGNSVGTTDSTNTKTGTDINTINGTEDKTGTDTFKHELKRHGNLGVTTSQQMLESEIALRQKMIIDIVFNDLDDILTISYRPLSSIPDIEEVTS